MASKIEEQYRERLARTAAGLGITSDSDSSAESSALTELPLRSKLSLGYMDVTEAENLSYTEFAWKFLCLNRIFIEESNEKINGTKEEKADVAAFFSMKHFKHHSESFQTGITPRFNSSSISFWSNIDTKTHGEKRSVPRKLREEEVFVLFNLKEASEIAEESLDIQLRQAAYRLRRLLKKYKEIKHREIKDTKKKKPERLTLSPLYRKASLAKHYNLYLATQFHPNLNDKEAYKIHFPSESEECSEFDDPDEILKDRSTRAMENARLIVFENYRKLALFDLKK